MLLICPVWSSALIGYVASRYAQSRLYEVLADTAASLLKAVREASRVLKVHRGWITTVGLIQQNILMVSHPHCARVTGSRFAHASLRSVYKGMTDTLCALAGSPPALDVRPVSVIQ